MLDRHATNIAGLIKIKQRILIEIAGFDDIRHPELDVQRIGILKICDLHGLKDLSKKAL